MNRLSRMLSFSVLLFVCLFLFVSCRSTSSTCAGTLHRVAVTVSGSTVTVNPATLTVNGGDCVEWDVSSPSASTRYTIGQIQFEDPAGSSVFTRTVARPATIRLDSGTRAYNLVVPGLRAPTMSNAPVIVIQCFPPQCIKPPARIRVSFAAR